MAETASDDVLRSSLVPLSQGLLVERPKISEWSGKWWNVTGDNRIFAVSSQFHCYLRPGVQRSAGDSRCCSQEAKQRCGDHLAEQMFPSIHSMVRPLANNQLET